MTFKLLLATALGVACMHADVMYTIPAGTTVGGVAVSGFVDFFVSVASGGSCTTNNTTTCVLNVEIENTEGGTSGQESLLQAISGVTFSLTSIGTSTVALSNTIGSVDWRGAVSGSVTTVPSSGTNGSTATHGNWKEENTPASWGGVGTLPGTYALTTATGTGATDLITDGNTANNSNFSSNSPSFSGPVYFQITGLKNLKTTTDISNIDLLFGDSSSGPQTDFALPAGDCVASSGNGGVCATGELGTGAIPEPASFLLVGIGLLSLFTIRRRRQTAQTSRNQLSPTDTRLQSRLFPPVLLR